MSLTREENELLTKVGPGTPMGALFRQYWIPAFASDEVRPGGDPKRVRLLGENLIAYRDANGELGLLDEYCPHRGASLAIGRAEPCGVRCIYHGWLVAPDGKILETPPEPDELGFKDRIRAKSYPVREVGGIAWAYLGSGAPGELQDFEFCGLPPENVLIMKARVDCNYAQVVEGVIDSSHSDYLHRDYVRFNRNTATTTALADNLNLDRPTTDGAPKIEVDNAPYGFRYAAIRKPVVDPDAQRLIRVTLWAAPFYGMFPAPKGWANMQMMVPVDDETTMFYYVKWCHDAPISAAEREKHAKWSGLHLGTDVVDPVTFKRKKGPWNDWLQDREAIRSGASYNGITGVNTQDFAVEESMGPVYDRTKEHLGTADAAVIRMRRLLIDAARQFAAGKGAPLGLQQNVPWRSLHADEAVLPAEENWRNVLSTTGSAVAERVG